MTNLEEQVQDLISVLIEQEVRIEQLGKKLVNLMARVDFLETFLSQDGAYQSIYPDFSGPAFEAPFELHTPIPQYPCIAANHILPENYEMP